MVRRCCYRGSVAVSDGYCVRRCPASLVSFCWRYCDFFLRLMESCVILAGVVVQSDLGVTEMIHSISELPACPYCYHAPYILTFLMNLFEMVLWFR